MALRVEAEGGLLRLASVPYDAAIVEQIRALPDRQYRRADHAWIVPARREHLRCVCGLIAELEERSVAVQIADSADQRLARLDIGRAMLRGRRIEIAGPYSPRRLPALRALPERRFDVERKIWTVPLTRAGAVAILTLAEQTDELVLTRRATRALQRTAAADSPTPRMGRERTARSGSPRRRSPVAHWRHYTAGPVFDNPRRPRIDVPGIGRCVRVRVNPRGAVGSR